MKQGSLLERVTQSESAVDEEKFSPDQVAAMIEFVVPRLISETPGMKPAGLTCTVTKDDKGWDIRIDKKPA